MHLRALTATLAVAVFAGGFISTAQAKALSQTSTTNSKSAVAVASENTTPTQTTGPTVSSVNVTPGESLSSIATQYNTTYIRLFDDNSQVQNPDLIYVGELINIPTAAQQLPDRYGAYKSALASSQASQVESQPAVSNASESSETESNETTPAAPVASPPVQPVAQVANTSVWTELAQCESGGNWSINTGNGFYGGLQFTLSSWRAVGGTGMPNDASESEQIAMAQKLQAEQGWGAWPVCSAKIGL